jgi:hypothetical protein
MQNTVGRELEELNVRPRAGPYYANRLSALAVIPIAPLHHSVLEEAVSSEVTGNIFKHAA